MNTIVYIALSILFFLDVVCLRILLRDGKSM